MNGDTTETDWGDIDITDRTGRNLITDISLTLTNMSSKNRAKRRQQKLRQDLVREYIEGREYPKSRLQTILRKLFK
jgi:hypothetical protein